ncbi:photosynthetic NDH subunit of subcomplex B 3, chloroplastic isoform X2 [Phalaenopsis equestris]|uniref:photosynthetic NDH subunit of subcomplex B 3, chloroplastic isoform X2 n=1 Tax=Phalaenopsis equestris TaxID=78828 RepID=UPI0009E4BE37|nr:photosynthetic NDH subunit of subcomplex B 3, chloroplastic isoform X2 [Phalaenopsis equestris]
MAAVTLLASSISPNPSARFSSQSLYLSSITPSRTRFLRSRKSPFCTFATLNRSPELEKPCIEVEFIGPKVGADGSYPVDRASAISGEKLLRNIMIDNKIELYAAYIIDGKDLLNEKTDTEKRYLKKKPESWRLACQTIVGNKENSGKVIVQRLPQWKK